MKKFLLLIFISIFLLGFKSEYFPYNIDANCSILIHTPIYDDCYVFQRKEPFMVIYDLQKSNGMKYPRFRFYTRQDGIPNDYLEFSRDYINTGYDRGHNCPNADFNFNRQEQYITFDMINITPQAPQLNRRYWAKLEKFERSLIRKYNSVDVITGSCGYEGRFRTGEVIPKWWFKIIYVRDINKWFCFLAPNINQGMATAPIQKYQTNLQTIEKICHFKIGR